MITDNNNLLYKNYKVKIKLDLPILLKTFENISMGSSEYKFSNLKKAF